jgi:hypothetical protein
MLVLTPFVFSQLCWFSLFQLFVPARQLSQIS